MLAIIYAHSLTGSSGGVTGTEVASVGGYTLGAETCVGVYAFVTSFPKRGTGVEGVLSELAPVAPLTISRPGFLSEGLLSTMGVWARCVASGLDEAKAGREVNRFCGVPVGGSSAEGRGGSVEDAWGLGNSGTTS
jgi:hypothetical protein